jgi:hypothetical protein
MPGWALALLVAGLMSVAALVLAIAGTVAFVFVLDKPDVARWDTARTHLLAIKKALDLYNLDNGEFPAALTDLEPKFFPQGLPLNPYTRGPFSYTPVGSNVVSGYRLEFLGKDGIKGGVEPPDKDVVFEVLPEPPNPPHAGGRQFR